MASQKGWYKRGGALLEEIARSRTGQGEALLWFFGQCGFALKISGVTLFIDVMLHDWTDEAGNRRLSAPPFEPQSAVQAAAFLCTHEHCDHLHLESLLPQARRNAETMFIVPAPSVKTLTGAGIAGERVIAAREGADITLAGENGGVTIRPVAAAHSGYEADERGDMRHLGYLIRGGGVTVFHAGDGLVTGRLLQTLREESPVHVAILPINGADWERESRGIVGNMNCEDAVQLARAIDADLTIPAHFDFLEGNTVNPARFADVFYRLCPEKRFHICALGERFIYRL